MTRFLTRNFGWKAASLGAAFVLWMALSASRESSASITAEVQYRNIPRNLQISSEMVEVVHLVVRGPSLKLSRVRTEALPVVIDLGRLRGPGESTFTLTRENTSLPSSVTLERAIPGQIHLRLETRIAKQVPVRVRLTDVPQGMEVRSVKTIPETLTVLGPESRVSKLQEVQTDPVDLRTLDARGEAVTTAFAGEPQVSFEGKPEVRVQITLGPGGSRK